MHAVSLNCCKQYTIHSQMNLMLKILVYTSFYSLFSPYLQNQPLDVINFLRKEIIHFFLQNMIRSCYCSLQNCSWGNNVVLNVIHRFSTSLYLEFFEGRLWLSIRSEIFFYLFEYSYNSIDFGKHWTKDRPSIQIWEHI